MLLVCLLDMPYGYYQFIRFVALMGFGYIGYKYYQSEQFNLAYIFFALAVLFQPIFKISLGRELWNIVDVIVAIFLVFMAFRFPPKTKGDTRDTSS